jgi:large subunit ribosomal protein L21e
MTGKRIGGYRRRTRYKLQKETRTKGKISLTKYFQKFNVGDRVKLDLEPAVQTGIFHPRYNGKVGTVVGKSGGCYVVIIKDVTKEKSVIVHPVHLAKN